MTEQAQRNLAAPPRISVIVTAFDRKEYLLEAVRSVLASVDGTPVEIWVVKNFRDPEIDHELEARGVRHLETDAPSLGAKLALGIERSSGDVLAFLEDDDGYEPGRLARVAELFGAAPELGYYRNGQRRIGPGGAPLPSDGGRAAENLIRYGTVAGGPGELSALLPKLVRIDPDFNLSSIAVRRAVLADRLAELSGLAAAIDSFVFYAALEQRRGLWIEARPLTRYRVHPANVSLWRGPDTSAVEARAAYQRRFLEAFGGVVDRLRERGPDAATRLAASAYYGTWILYRLLTGLGGRWAMLRDLGRFWRDSPGAALRYRWDLSVWGLAAILAPTFARHRFVRRRELETASAADPPVGSGPTT